MKLKIGQKEIEFTIRDMIYWVGLVGMGVAWYTTNRINAAKNEIRIVIVEQANKKQDAEIDKLNERDYAILENISSLRRISEHE